MQLALDCHSRSCRSHSEAKSTGTPPLATPWHRCNYNRVIITDPHAWRKRESWICRFLATSRDSRVLTLSNQPNENQPR
jgi:hypothetical protein